MERKEAIKNVADSVIKIMDGYNGSSVLMLENSAGQGDTIGDTFEEVAEAVVMTDGEVEANELKRHQKWLEENG